MPQTSAKKYRIEVTKPAEKSLLKLPERERGAIRDKIDALADNPRPHGSKKLKGAGDLHRIRSGDYRVIYRIQDRLLLIVVVRVAHRRDVYWDT